MIGHGNGVGDRRSLEARSVLPALAAVLLLAALGTATPHAMAQPAAPDARAAPASEPIRYTLSFPDARHHYVEVEASVPTGGAEAVELAMAVWTPGSYLVREYARHVEAVEAETPGGEPLAVEKSAKNRWRIAAADEREGTGRPRALPERVQVRYRVYGRELTVRTNFVDASFAILNGAPTFLTLAADLEAGTDRPHEVEVRPAEGWSRVVSPLPPIGGEGADAGTGTPPHRFLAADYDTLVDSPLYAGNAPVYAIEVDGAPHLLVNEGESPPWDGERAADALAAIAAEQIAFWGVRPYERYVVFNLIAEAGGGLEHKASTVLLTRRYRPGTRDGWLGWLGLVSHELFHTWNVKRLRPVELGPFDYEEEVHTESLWVAEGVTSYYDDLLVHRAGLSSRNEALDDLSDSIERLEETPGRLVQPLDRASFDAWIKHYRRDENTVNTAISYYTKGAVVAFLLDAEIRRATDGAASLDDVMREAYERYSGERGFAREEFEALASEVAGRDLSAFFARTVDSTGPLDYEPALDWFGLRFADPEAERGAGEEGEAAGADGGAPSDEETTGGDGSGRGGGESGAGAEAELETGESPEKPAAEPDEPEAAAATGTVDPGDGPRRPEGEAGDEEPAAWLGAETEVRGGRLVVTGVRRGTPAWEAGLNVEDEILAFDGFRVPPDGLPERLAAYRPGASATALVARRGRLTELSVVFREEPGKRFRLEVDPEAGPEQRARLDAWLESSQER